MSAELAARHGCWARFWPRDRIDADATGLYPRVELNRQFLPKAKHLRLRRRGDLFTFMVSADGETYLPWCTHRMAMPKTVNVGLGVSARPDGKPMTGVFTDLRLDGHAVVGPAVTDVGKVKKPSDAKREGEVWTINTFGVDRAGDYRGTGALLYVRCTGDFDVDASLEKVISGGKWYYTGLVCRPDLEAEGPMVGIDGNGAKFSAFWKPRHGVVRWHEDDGTHYIVATLKTAPDKERVLAPVFVTWRTWQDLTGSVRRLADALIDALRGELALKAGDGVAARVPTAAQRTVLAAGRNRALNLSTVQIVAASKAVDRVIGQSPTCVEAHRRAALCGSLLAAHDLYGRFHERGRYLAGPLSHWLLAERLGAAADADGALDTAWVMLACGYPRSVDAVLDGLYAPARQRPEARALRMFITRDCRSIAPKAVGKARPIEQLAWMWAAQDTGRHDFDQGYTTTSAVNAQCAALLPIYITSRVGPGHSLTQLLPALAYWQDAYTFLTDDRIPQDDRLRSARAIAIAVGLGGQRPLGLTVAALQAQFAEGRIPWETADGLAALLDLYAAARTVPVGVTATDDGLTWRSLSPHDVADLRSGFLLFALYRRADFMGGMWGVSEAADGFCRTVAAGAADVPGMRDLFTALGQSYLDHPRPAIAALNRALKTPLGQTLPLKALLGGGWSGRCPGVRRLRRLPGRGAWDLALSARGASSLGYEFRICSSGWRCFEIDPCAGALAFTLCYAEPDLNTVSAMIERMPYSRQLVYEVGWHAQHEAMIGLALRCYRRMKDLAPSDSRGYSMLADLYASADQHDAAIEVGIEAGRHCRQSVGLCNLLGDTARWLVMRGRNREALEWGERAAAAGSYDGLAGYAAALDANGRAKEALNVYRGIARRYESGAKDLVRVLLDRDTDPAVVRDEIRAVLALYGRSRDTAALWAGLGYAAAGRLDLLEDDLEGLLADVKGSNRYHCLLIGALIARRFDKVKAYGARLKKIRSLFAWEALWFDAAIRLGRTVEARGQRERRLRRHQWAAKHGDHVRYLLGDISRDELINKNGRVSADRAAYTYWVLGIEAELKGDSDEAIKCYRRVVRVSSLGNKVQHAARRWVAALERSTESTSRPARPAETGAPTVRNAGTR